MSLSNNIPLQNRCETVIKDITPYASGQLLFSIHTGIITDGFYIRQSGALAKHGAILNEAQYAGKSKTIPNIHKHWWDVKSYDAVVGIINSIGNGTFKEKEYAQTYERVQEKPYTARANANTLRAIGVIR